MNGVNDAEVVSLQLSHEEVLAILALLQADTIPGLEEDEVEEWSEEQQQFALSLARRVLQSRGFAQVQDGVFMLHRAVLTAVGVCAYSQSAAMVYHWSDAAIVPTSFFAHLRERDAVLHTRPAPSMHSFALQPSKDALVDAILEACEYSETADTVAMDLLLSRDAFARARELAEKGRLDEARQQVGDGTSDGAAQAFTEMLASLPRVSIFQTLKQQKDKAVHTRQFTLLQSAPNAWLVTAVSDAEDAPLRAKTIRAGTLHSALNEWL